MKKENNIKLHARMVYSPPPSPAHNHRSPTKQIEKLAHLAEFAFLRSYHTFCLHYELQLNCKTGFKEAVYQLKAKKCKKNTLHTLERRFVLWTRGLPVAEGLQWSKF